MSFGNMVFMVEGVIKVFKFFDKDKYLCLSDLDYV